ncbi:hypothetical protein BamMEX5DRAFT_1183 [Burkholderia ambifaria MEX-5]|uniref:Uncharacterized protein n=1 Tax=Burkholderia ambifaria MEX-5 TaxID=396597 RepID=B1T067_9BURK|nr:hypothetical protein BamMEX5DRAFT_1183 [Burkholderia ambifaria MEX-5]
MLLHGARLLGGGHRYSGLSNRSALRSLHYIAGGNFYAIGESLHVDPGQPEP